jgi:hypothetical protein
MLDMCIQAFDFKIYIVTGGPGATLLNWVILYFSLMWPQQLRGHGLNNLILQ